MLLNIATHPSYSLHGASIQLTSCRYLSVCGESVYPVNLVGGAQLHYTSSKQFLTAILSPLSYLFHSMYCLASSTRVHDTRHDPRAKCQQRVTLVVGGHCPPRQAPSDSVCTRALALQLRDAWWSASCSHDYTWRGARHSMSVVRVLSALSGGRTWEKSICFSASF